MCGSLVLKLSSEYTRIGQQNLAAKFSLDHASLGWCHSHRRCHPLLQLVSAHAPWLPMLSLLFDPEGGGDRCKGEVVMGHMNLQALVHLGHAIFCNTM